MKPIAIKLEENIENSRESAPPSISEELQHKLTIHEQEDMLQKEDISASDRIIDPNLAPSLSPYQKWLQKLSFRNHIPFIQLISWAEELVQFLRGESLLYHQPFPGLIFQPIKACKNPHYCYIKRLTADFSLLKLRGFDGQLLNYKIVSNQQRINELIRIAKKLGPKGIFIVWDEYESEEFLVSPLKPMSYCNLIYINNHIQENKQWKLTNYSIIKWQHLQVVHTLKALTKINLQEHLEKLVLFEQEDIGLLNSIFAQLQTQIFYDRSYLLINLIRQDILSNYVCVSRIITIFEQSINHLKNLLIKINLHKNTHFPCRSKLVERKICSWCNKRKTDICCNGCQLIFGKEMNFCVGQCIMNYHLYLQELSLSKKDKRQQIVKDMKGIAAKCKEIDNKMQLLQIKNNAAKQENKSMLPDYIDYIGKRMVNYLNTIAKHRLESKTEDRNINYQ